MKEIKNVVIMKIPTNDDGNPKYSIEAVRNIVKYMDTLMPNGYKFTATLDAELIILSEDGESKVKQIPEFSFEKLMELINEDDEKGD